MLVATEILLREWKPEKIQSLLPQKFSIVDIKIISDTERELLLRNK